MTIFVETRAIEKVRVSAPTAVPGIGFSRLQFPLEIELRGLPEPRAVVSHVVANVSASAPGSASRPLGKATTQNSWSVFTLSDARSQTISLELDLAGERLEALERLRGGGPIEFQFDLSIQVRRAEPDRRPDAQRRADPAPPRTEDVNMWVHRAQLAVDVSQWTQVLRQVGYMDFLLVAVELPFDAPEELREAVQRLNEAHADLIAGRYNATVGGCRLAMESVGRMGCSEASQNQIRTAFAGSEDSRRGMAPGDRAELVRMAVRHFCHPALHVGENGAPEIYSRHDALFILTAAAGVVWEAIGQRRARP